MPIIPKSKPKNYSKILDMLNSKSAVNTFSPKTYVNLVGEYAKKALDNKEISEGEYMNIVKPLFGDVGIMATKAIEKQREQFSNGTHADDDGTLPIKQKTKTGPIKGGKTPQLPVEEFEKYQKMIKKKQGRDYAATGGRINFGDGDEATMDPDVVELRKLVERLMDEEGFTFGEAVKEAMKQGYAEGGRIKFKSGGNYWSMVTRAFIEAGAEDGTGMSINEFAEMYFPKMKND